MTRTMSSRMHLETRQIAERVRVALAAPLPALPPVPRALHTLARGSSDHAATVVHRLLAAAGIPATTLPPSLIGEPNGPGGAALRLDGATLLALSQSGASPDLCTAAERCARQGSAVIALVNAEGSPLADVASTRLSQHAGEERAVAATKSVVCSIVAGARLAEHWGAPAFGLDALPDQIEEMQGRPFDALAALFAADGPLLVIGRGSGLGVAAEIALKVQELLGRPAMAYSSAEVLHGPAGMVTAGYPVLALAHGPEADSVRSSVERLRELGAAVSVLDESPRDDSLAATAALAHAYLALESACRARGRSPDKPDNLSKVTLTR